MRGSHFIFANSGLVSSSASTSAEKGIDARKEHDDHKHTFIIFVHDYGLNNGTLYDHTEMDALPHHVALSS